MFQPPSDAREKTTRAAFLMEVFVLAKEREMATEIRCANSLLLPEMVGRALSDKA